VVLRLVYFRTVHGNVLRGFLEGKQHNMILIVTHLEESGWSLVLIVAYLQRVMASLFR
jgi:hypothetical protein